MFIYCGVKNVLINHVSGTIVVRDRISALPDHILSHILQFLSQKEATATSILSKRWKKLWLLYPYMDFDNRCSKNYIVKAFIQRIDKTLGQFNAPKLHVFKVFSKRPRGFKSHITNWISLAIKNGVSELVLQLGNIDRTGSIWNYYVSSYIFGEDIKHCTLSLANSPDFAKHFEFRRVLCLRCVNLCNGVFNKILSRCSFLEKFLLMNDVRLVYAKNKAPHLNLKRLELYNCVNLKKLDLLAPNLTTFRYQGSECIFCILNAHKLVSLDLMPNIFLERNSNASFPKKSSSLISQSWNLC